MEIIVETPKNSKEKFEYEEKTGIIRLTKILPLGMTFPYDFGLIPGTKGEDGDPLDAMIISEHCVFPGCRVDCRLIGVLKAEQSEDGKKIRNDRYFFIPKTSVTYQHIQSIEDFPAKHNEELLFFFMAYNEGEGKKFRPIKLLNSSKARKLLKQS